MATSGPGVLSGSTNNAASKKESNGDASDGGDAENQQQLMMQQMQQQQQQMQGGGMPGQEEELSAIERFCTDVTDEAKKGLLDPLVGTDERRITRFCWANLVLVRRLLWKVWRRESRLVTCLCR